MRREQQRLYDVQLYHVSHQVLYVLYDEIRCSFIDPPWEKFTGNAAVQREISSKE